MKKSIQILIKTFLKTKKKIKTLFEIYTRELFFFLSIKIIF